MKRAKSFDEERSASSGTDVRDGVPKRTQSHKPSTTTHQERTRTRVALLKEMEGFARLSEGIARKMQDTIERLSALDLEERGERHREDGLPSAGGVKGFGLNYKAGDNVTITVRDKYCGMRGELVSPRGKMFWYIRMAREGDEEGELIWKMTTSFKPAGNYA